MRLLQRTGVIVSILAIGIIGWGVASQAGAMENDWATASTRPTAVVQITNDFRFNPTPITIKVGDTVKWVNNTQLEHTVTCDPKQAKYPTHVILPANAQPFDSGYLMPGDVFSNTFQVPGTYRYVCTIHESAQMIGEVIVNTAEDGSPP